MTILEKLNNAYILVNSFILSHTFTLKYNHRSTVFNNFLTASYFYN